jgi:RecA-family ATPase
MKIRDGYELCQQKATPLQWLVDGLIPANVAGDVFSPPDSGKSTILSSLASAIANGDPTWFGYALTSGRVAYIGGEKSSSEVWTRDLLRAGVGIRTPGTFVNYDPENCLWRWDKRAGAWEESAEYHEVVKHLKTMQPVLTIIDTISRAAMGSDPMDLMQQVLLAQRVDILQQTVGGTVLTVSHTNQSSMSETLPQRLHYTSRSGGNGYVGWLRFMIGVSNLNVPEKEALGIDEFRKVVAMAVSKHNEMPQPMPAGNRFNPILLEITRIGELVQVDKSCSAVELPSRREIVKRGNKSGSKVVAIGGKYEKHGRI